MEDRVSLTGNPFEQDNAFVLNGVLYDIGARCVKWKEDIGMNAYDRSRKVIEDEDRRTGSVSKRVIKGTRYSKRRGGISAITQLFIHHTGGPLPRRAFDTLHNQRGLSVHFILSDKGVLFQTLDAIEKAWHAGRHNNCSIGVECCLYPDAERRPNYYSPERCDRLDLTPHVKMVDEIHGRKWEVYAITEVQLDALSRLFAGLWRALKLQGVDVPPGPPKFFRGIDDAIPHTVIDNPRGYVGMIGHLQATRRKVDPAGFPWDAFEEQVADRFAEFLRAA